MDKHEEAAALDASRSPNGSISVPTDIFEQLVFGCEMLQSEYEGKAPTGYRIAVITKMRSVLLEAERIRK